jgi:hypothetical protein
VARFRLLSAWLLPILTLIASPAFAQEPDDDAPAAAPSPDKKDDAPAEKKDPPQKKKGEKIDIKPLDDVDPGELPPPPKPDEPDVVSSATPPLDRDDEGRPPLPDVKLPGELPWQRHGEIGVDFAWMSRPFNRGLVPDSRVHYRPFPAFGMHLHWALWQWLHAHPYFFWGLHPITIPRGALSTGAPNSIRPDAVIDAPKVQHFVFGLKLAPTWNVSNRWRLWASVGIGYGRFGFKGLTVTEGNKQWDLPNRDGVFVEVPIGAGVSVDVLPRWLAITAEVSGAPVFGQSGQAHQTVQAVDADGKTRDIGPFGAIQASFVQTIGLALIL